MARLADDDDGDDVTKARGDGNGKRKRGQCKCNCNQEEISNGIISPLNFIRVFYDVNYDGMTSVNKN